MQVQVKIEQLTPSDEQERERLRIAAASISNDEGSVEVLPLGGDEVGVEVRFSMADAQKRDVVDGIAARFKRALCNVSDYQDMTISFDKRRPKNASGKKRITPKQGQYLAFIYYYTKVNGMPPVDADMQRYFKVSPPSVHGMVVALEKGGYIRRTPRKSRSIELLVGRGEIPDLE